MSKKRESVAALRRRVLGLAGEYASAIGRAQFSDGYRTGRSTPKLYRKSVERWDDAMAAYVRLKASLRAFERAVKQQAAPAAQKGGE